VNNLETIRSITENINALLTAEGLNLAKESSTDNKSVPASLFPYGIVSYEGETFEFTHGQRPGYSDADFTVTVALKNSDLKGITDDEQSWVHKIRGALTVKAMNSGRLVASMPVSRVSAKSVTVDRKGYVSRLVYSLTIRYR